MLSPALQRLSDEIDQVPEGARSPFEIALTRELTALSDVLAGARSLMPEPSAPSDGAKPKRLGRVAMDRRLSVTLGLTTGLGSGHPINTSTRCSLGNCPNRRIK